MTDWTYTWTVGLVVILGSGVVVSYGCRGASDNHNGAGAESAAEHADSQDKAGESPVEAYPTETRVGRQLGLLDVVVDTPAGAKQAGVRCSTCHASMVDGPMKKHADELEEFHRNMTFDHGDQTCASCHAEDDRDKLRLADGQTVSFDRTMELCGQCHGPQMRDYQNGAHGGMTGHWDRTQGGRVRNNCVSCHDPHAPAFPDVAPADGPKDRFLDENHDHSGEASEGTDHSRRTGGTTHE